MGAVLPLGRSARLSSRSSCLDNNAAGGAAGATVAVAVTVAASDLLPQAPCARAEGGVVVDGAGDCVLVPARACDLVSVGVTGFDVALDADRAAGRGGSLAACACLAVDRERERDATAAVGAVGALCTGARRVADEGREVATAGVHCAARPPLCFSSCGADEVLSDFTGATLRCGERTPPLADDAAAAAATAAAVARWFAAMRRRKSAVASSSPLGAAEPALG